MSISKGAFKHVESELYAYPDVKKEIERLRLEIQYPHERTEDVNIVKGASSVRQPGDPTGQTATALASNRTLEQLERIADVIDSVVTKLPEEKKRLVQLWYWTRPRMLSWDGVALELNISRRQAIRWRNGIVIQIARAIGWR